MSRPLALLATAALFACASLPAHAVGRLVDLQVVDRETGQRITPIAHRGEWWIAGRPGARYDVSITSRTGRRTLNVVSVDGVNVMSGEDASWSQSGYVLDPWTDTVVRGWRKSLRDVAAFEFTSLPDSYAARTGRPGNVGVIGVAVFNERIVRPPVPIARADQGSSVMRSMKPSEDALPAPAPESSPADARAEAESAAESARSRAAAPSAPKLGTGHGAIEESPVRWVRFDRAGSAPDEVIVIRYDRTENLVAMGILPRPGLPPVAANPFPAAPGFVPDPPRR